MDTNQLLQNGWWPGKKHSFGQRLLQVGTLGAYNPDDRFSSAINKKLIAMDAETGVRQRALEGQLRAAGDEEARRNAAAFEQARSQRRLTAEDMKAEFLQNAQTQGIAPEQANVMWSAITNLSHNQALTKGVANILEDANRATSAEAVAPLAGALATQSALAQGAKDRAAEATADTVRNTAPGIASATNARNDELVRDVRTRAAVENPYDTIKRLQQELADKENEARRQRELSAATEAPNREAAIDTARTAAAVARATADAAAATPDLGTMDLAKKFGITLAPGSTFLTPSPLKAMGTNTVQAPFRPAAPGMVKDMTYDPLGKVQRIVTHPLVPGTEQPMPNGLVPIDPTILSNILQRTRR